MKKIFIFILLGFMILVNCNNKYFPKGKSESCDQYYKWIKKNWKEQSSGIFYFKPFEEYNDIIEHKMYRERACLLNLNKSEIEFIFGKPTSIYQPNTKVQTYNYCISYNPNDHVDNCFKAQLINKKKGSFTIVMDSINIVENIYFSPAPTGD